MLDITLAQAIEGYRIDAEARNLSRHTLADYNITFSKFLGFIDPEMPVDKITKHDIRQFMLSLNGLSKKTKLNYHIGLSALWTWLLKEDLVGTHIVRQVDAPRPEKRTIDPFSEQDVKLMLSVIESYSPCRLRDKAVVLILLDNGLRASELCNLTIQNTDLRNRQLKVMGKGSKERVVPISPKTAKVIWKYHTTRTEIGPGDGLVANRYEQPLTRSGLLQLVKRNAEMAGIKDAHPHRFRHTFAINYLRNGGNPFALQQILGHSSMRMVGRYVKVARADISFWHKAASPVMNWKLG